MQIPSEPPSCAFTDAQGTDCHCLIPAEDSLRPLRELPASILIPLDSLERIHLTDSRELMRASIMRARLDLLLVYGTPQDRYPQGAVARRSLAIELLTGNRPDIPRLVSPIACLPDTFLLDEALRELTHQKAQFCVICAPDGEAIGLCSREGLLLMKPSRQQART